MENIFYHVCRGTELQLGLLELVSHEELRADLLDVRTRCTVDDIQQHLQAAYPYGLSPHGRRYLSRPTRFVDIGDCEYVPSNPVIELAYELVRQIKFPDLPSRFTSIFGWATLGEALLFKLTHGSTDDRIYRVSCVNSLRVDMNMVHLGRNLAATSLLAERYWRGEASEIPQWEVLLQGPIEVIEQIQ